MLNQAAFRDCNVLIGPKTRTRRNLQEKGRFLLVLLQNHLPIPRRENGKAQNKTIIHSLQDKIMGEPMDQRLGTANRPFTLHTHTIKRKWVNKVFKL